MLILLSKSFKNPALWQKQLTNQKKKKKLTNQTKPTDVDVKNKQTKKTVKWIGTAQIHSVKFDIRKDWVGRVT